MTDFDLTQLGVKVYDLGAYPYSADPLNWEQPSFDDSTWINSVDPTMVLVTNGGNTSAVWFGFSPSTLPPSVEACWPTTLATSLNQGSLFRWHIDLPTTRTLVSVTTRTPDPTSTVRTEFWVNGTSVGSGIASLLNATTAAALVTGDNLIAFKVYSVSPGSPMWPGYPGSAAWFTLKWVINTGDDMPNFVAVIG